MSIDLTKHGFTFPLKEYKFGMTWEIRDQINRVVLKLQPLKADITYRNYMDELLKTLTDLLNANSMNSNFYGESIQKKHVPLLRELDEKCKKNTDDLDKSVSVGSEITIPEGDSIPVKKRGRPKKVTA